MYKSSNLWSHSKKRKISWFISFPVFRKKFSCNQGKWGLSYCYFRPVLAIRVTEILNAFRGFVPELHLGARAQYPYLQSLQRIYNTLLIIKNEGKTQSSN